MLSRREQMLLIAMNPLMRPAAAAAGLLSQAAIDSLVSWWKLDETSGNRADAHGSNDLTETLTVDSTTGKQGNAADFYGGSYLSRESSVTGMEVKDTEPYSVALWASIDLFGSLDGIFSYANGANSFAGFYLRALNGTIRFTIGGFHLSSAVLSTTTWYFVVAWYSAADDKMYLSIDNGTPVEFSLSSFSIPEPRKIGIGIDVASPSGRNLDGFVDEVAVFPNHELSADDRTALYNSGDGITYEQATGN